MATSAEPAAASEPLTPEVERALRAVAARFAERFQKDTPRTATGARLAQQHALGPGAVARSVRRATGRSLADGIAELGFRIERAAQRPASARARVDARAPCAVTCAAIALRSAAGGAVQIEVGGRASGNLELSRHALEPLIERGEVELTEAGEEGAEPAALIVGGEARTSIVIAPYYFVSRDLDRLATQVALEIAMPCPHSEGGLDLLLPRGWEQRAAFAARLATKLTELGAEPVEITLLEATDVVATLESAGARDPVPAATVAFVYPMWRERPAVERALRALVSRSQLGMINHRPSIAWQLGVGVPVCDVLLDVDQRVRTSQRSRFAGLRASYDAQPSLGRAVAVALSNFFAS